MPKILIEIQSRNGPMLVLDNPTDALHLAELIAANVDGTHTIRVSTEGHRMYATYHGRCDDNEH